VDHHQQQQQQALTVAADDWQRGSTEYGKSCEEQREAAAATPEQRPRPRQLLLVATKLTGDVNVPAGAVTFAADLVSRSTAGAGARLLLPPGTDCDVQLNRAGMRQLRVKVRHFVTVQCNGNAVGVCWKVMPAKKFTAYSLTLSDRSCIFKWQSTNAGCEVC
jgi:hypothetical protein